MSKKKGNRTEEARRGTRADPARRAEQERMEAQRELEGEAGLDRSGKRPSWYLDPLDKHDLSSKETITRYLYIVTEIILFANVFLYLLVLSSDLEEATLEALQALITSDATYVIEIIGELLQIAGGFIVLSCYKRYLEGNVGPVMYSLILMACAECALQNISGIVCLLVLIWRSWSRCSAGLSGWRIERTFWEKAADCAPSVIFLVLAATFSFAGTAG